MIHFIDHFIVVLICRKTQSWGIGNLKDGGDYDYNIATKQ